MQRSYRTRQASGVPGWGPAPGWGQPLPGWSPLVDHHSLPLRMAGSLSRWWWPTLALAGFGAVVGFVLSHDQPSPGLSTRGLLTIALAALVVVLLTLHRRSGPRWLARAVAEYATVALRATLLAAPAGTLDQHPADRPASSQAPAQAAAGQDQPTVLRPVTKVLRAGAKVIRGMTGAVRWVVELWHRADQQATTRDAAMPAPPPSPAPPAFSTWRFHP